jgi:hypothetical protein
MAEPSPHAQHQALAAAASHCQGTLVLADDIVGTESDPPALFYIGGSPPESDTAEWWRPNFSFYQQTLTRLGFARLNEVASFTSSVRPGGEIFTKRILHAHRV